MNWILVGILCYICAQLLIAAFASRRIANEEDYLLAGRSLGLPLAFFTIFATWFGSETCVGAAGIVYREGLSGTTADPFGYALCLAVMGLVLAKRLWDAKLTTIADLFRMRYGVLVERLAALMMIPTSLLWAAAQIRAFGQILSASSTLSLEITIALAGLVVIVYTCWGGLMADVVTDLVQGLVLILGLVLLLLLMFWNGAGPETILRSVPADSLTLPWADESGLWAQLERWSIPICGSLVAQELVARVLASRNAAIARRASVIAAVAYLVIGLIPLYIGLTAIAVLPDLSEPDQALVQVARLYLPEVAYIIFVGALVSAILSTVDSALLAASSLLSHNLLLPMFGARRNEIALRLSRGSVLVFGICAYVVARSADTIYSLVEEASAFGSAGLVVLLFFGLFSRWGSAVAGVASLVSGLAVWLAATHFVPFEYPYLLSLSAALAAFLGGCVYEHFGANESKAA